MNPPIRNGKSWVFALVLFAFFVDALCKAAVSHYFLQTAYRGRELVVIHDFFGIKFSLLYATNRGAAWGLFSQWHGWLLSLRLIAVAWLFGYMVSCSSRGRLFSIALITAGALGNIFDSFFYGHVVDMFFFTFWGYGFAVFNVADALITVGVFLLFMSLWGERNSPSSIGSS